MLQYLPRSVYETPSISSIIIANAIKAPQLNNLIQGHHGNRSNKQCGEVKLRRNERRKNLLILEPEIESDGLSWSSAQVDTDWPPRLWYMHIF